ncbi:MAG: hypothetical protein ACLQVN_20745 [Bryobacteraceae bacterium]
MTATAGKNQGALPRPAFPPHQSLGVPLRRTIITAGGALCVTPFVLMCLLRASGKQGFFISLPQYGLIVATGALLFAWAGRLLPRCYSPLLFAVLYLCGYVIQFPLIDTDLKHYVYDGGGVREVGSFPFTADAYWEVVCAVCSGALGMICGQALVRHFLSAPTHETLAPISRSSLSRRIRLWAVASLAVLAIAGYLGVSRMTLQVVILPYKLAGILHWLRYYVLPLIGLYLFGVGLMQRRRKAAVQILSWNVVFICIVVVTTMSKATGFNLWLPYVAVLALFPAARSLLRLRMVVLILATVTISAAVIVTVNYLRSFTLLSGDAASLAEVDGRIEISTITNNQNILYSLALNSVLRVLGATGLMAVQSAPPMKSVTPLLRLEGIDPELGAVAYRSAFNYTLGNRSDYVIGKGIGLYAFFFWSHSYLTVFLGSALYAGALLFFEGLASRVGNAALGIGVAFYGAVATWEGNFELHVKFVLAVLLLIIWIRRGRAKGAIRYGPSPRSS